MGVMLSYLYVGGHVQNETLMSTYGTALLPYTAATRAMGYDNHAGTTCVDDACHEECTWWNPSVGNNTDTECAVHMLRRALTLDGLERALAQANRCAVRATEECILSHEVGLRVPGVFVWNASEARMRLFLMPRARAVAEKAASRRVALLPAGARASAHYEREATFVMTDVVGVTHFDAWRNTERTDVLRDEAAYCVQLMFRTIPDACADVRADGDGGVLLVDDTDGRL
jgi:hypothetical protein